MPTPGFTGRNVQASQWGERSVVNESSQLVEVIAGGVMAGILAGMSAAFLWFRRSKERLFAEIVETKKEFLQRHEFMQIDSDRRYDKIEVQVSDVWKILNQNAVQMGVLTTSQANIATGLEDLKQEGREQNRKLAELLTRRRTAEN